MFNFKDSSELLDYAFRQVEEALNKGERETKILLGEFGKGDDYGYPDEICEKFEIGTITEMLRERFNNNHIKSGVEARSKQLQKKRYIIRITWIITFFEEG